MALLRYWRWGTYTFTRIAFRIDFEALCSDMAPFVSWSLSMELRFAAMVTAEMVGYNSIVSEGTLASLATRRSGPI